MQEDAAEPAAPAAPASSAVPVVVNVGISARSYGEPIDATERDRRKEALDDLVELMRPAVQADGGDNFVSLDTKRKGVAIQRLEAR